MSGTSKDSSIVILRDFTLSRDLHRVNWRATVIYNGMRGVACGLTWMFLSLAILPPDQIVGALLFPIFWPLLWLTSLPLGFALSMIRFRGIWEAIPPCLALFVVSPGDPWVFFLSLARKGSVPMSDPPIFSLQLAWLVLRGEEITIVNELRSQGRNG